MAITVTTLSAAVATTDAVINVTSATGITAPNFTVGTGITLLYIDQEYMLVIGAPSGSVVPVQRGYFGTTASAHVNGTAVAIGLPADFPAQFYLKGLIVSGFSPVGWTLPAVNLTGTADAINPLVPAYYMVKTGSADLMTLAAPTAAQEGNVIIVASDTAFAHTITATALLANGTALKTTATFAAFRGSMIGLRATNLVWHQILNTAVTLT